MLVDISRYVCIHLDKHLQLYMCMYQEACTHLTINTARFKNLCRTLESSRIIPAVQVADPFLIFIHFLPLFFCVLSPQSKIWFPTLSLIRCKTNEWKNRQRKSNRRSMSSLVCSDR